MSNSYRIEWGLPGSGDRGEWAVVQWVWSFSYSKWINSTDLLKNSVIQAYFFPLIMQILCSSEIEGLWQPHLKQVYWHYFSNSVWSLNFSLSDFSNSCNVSNHFIIIFVIVCDSGLWYYCCKRIMAHWKLRG